MSYLNITPEKGKWYISEGWEVGNQPPAVKTPEERAEMLAHNQGKRKMILAGPFDTKQAAQSQLKEHVNRHDPFVWCCEE